MTNPAGRPARRHVATKERHARQLVTVELAGPVGSWDVPGAILATGAGSDGVQHSGEGAPPTGVVITSEHGRDIVEVPAAS